MNWMWQAILFYCGRTAQNIMGTGKQLLGASSRRWSVVRKVQQVNISGVIYRRPGVSSENDVSVKPRKVVGGRVVPGKNESSGNADLPNDFTAVDVFCSSSSTSIYHKAVEADGIVNEYTQCTVGGGGTS